MNDLLEQAKTFFSGGTGMTVISVFVVWGLGSLSGSKPYKAGRAAWGKACKGVGVTIDRVVGSKLGRHFWNPIEKVLVDFLGFGSEQIVAGLQENDLVAMAEQHERLESVGSVARLEMVKEKMEKAIAAGVEISGKNPVIAKVLADSEAWALRKLKGNG